MNKSIDEILAGSLALQLNELTKICFLQDLPKSKEYIAMIIEKIYIDNSAINERFSMKKYTDYLQNKIEKTLLDEAKGSEEILKAKIKNSKIFTEDNAKEIFSELLAIKPQNLKVYSPVSGIFLEKNSSPFQIGPFVIQQGADINQPFADNKLLYISVTLYDIYDVNIAISKANDTFKDFIRLVVFIYGRNDKNIEIVTGLPTLTDVNREHAYGDSESFFIENEANELEFFNKKNKIIKKIPIDNEFFINNEDFKSLWSLYDTREKKSRKNTLKERLLNSSLALGQSMNDREIKNSIIYTCIALEILFSFDEGSLFQKSISDKLADTLVFIVAKDLNSRIKTSSLIKRFYGLRSALVHGGNKKTTQEYIAINILLRAAIKELLNNPKYKNIDDINSLYSMVREAHYSYPHKP